MDEEALASHLSPADRKVTGAFFTPRVLVDQALDAITPTLPAGGPVWVVDPACGAGAFLVAAAERWPAARLVGVDLDPTSAAQAQARVPRAQVLVGDALSSPVLDHALGPAAGFELWVGNPPYNGTSALLKDAERWRAVCGWLPHDLAPGLSLREDYVFFLLKASLRLAGRPGALTFITSASLLDTFAYAPVRQALLERLSLREVRELPPGAFAGTRVRTAITTWTSPRDGERQARFEQQPFSPAPPAFLLRPLAGDASSLDRAWRADGASIEALIPFSVPGLKTRFDELLVDDDPDVLWRRLAAFLACKPAQLDDFAREFSIPPGLVPKLVAVHERAAGQVTLARAAVRRFLRYRGPLPMGPSSWCYLDRAFIPRGDHRLRGAYDPHLQPVKLVFNRLELPLAAHLVTTPGCVTAYRHSRFAPLEVPAPLVEDPGASRLTGAEPVVPNLTPLGLRWADQLGGPQAVFEHVARRVMSDPFQRVWAPAFGRVQSPLIAAPR